MTFIGVTTVQFGEERSGQSVANEFGTVPKPNIAVSAVALVQVHQMPARSFGRDCNVLW